MADTVRLPNAYPPVEDLVTVDEVTITGDGTSRNPLRVVGGGAAAALASGQMVKGAFAPGGSTGTASLTRTDVGVFAWVLSAPPADWSKAVVTGSVGWNTTRPPESPPVLAPVVWNLENDGVATVTLRAWNLAGAQVDPDQLSLRLDIV